MIAVADVVDGGRNWGIKQRIHRTKNTPQRLYDSGYNPPSPSASDPRYLKVRELICSKEAMHEKILEENYRRAQALCAQDERAIDEHQAKV